MSAPTAETIDAEGDRRHRLEELDAEQGAGWREQYKPGSFGCHELLDRTSIALNALDENLLSHPACILNEEWFALVERASTALAELYQRIGQAHLADDSEGLDDEPAGRDRTQDRGPLQ